ncbi:TetR/AcrR family transcriptional regulator [Lichenicola cladoniae]|uniref:TetR/AcrR family transcriptional regulator n=1 Tax=Lichenicola cladoniae TaxID=1484109 RepID=A0A6M8HP60_9PROT|nr:TetR/AcrR family transcriptional regulator [Lichenicola cladoniae]NPD66556.1 TetR/AcrR family transcriptional regulator [Acetobacteraceae bacterium]QKE90233.1 TetR/AcrR family transcriptional regulator [Lichenicola cladoniae]
MIAFGFGAVKAGEVGSTLASLFVSCSSSAMGIPTLREENKQDKLQRIRAAARKLFGEQGFDLTTTREISVAAHVGLATLFLYARDKRDLLFLACNDDLAALTERAFFGLDDEAELADQLASAFRHFFVLYGENRRLYRDLLRELTFYTHGQQSVRFQAIRAATVGEIERLIRQARKRGEINSVAGDAMAAQIIFYIFAAEVRRWLGEEEVSAEAGAEGLERLLKVVIDGLR